MPYDIPSVIDTHYFRDRDNVYHVVSDALPGLHMEAKNLQQLKQLVPSGIAELVYHLIGPVQIVEPPSPQKEKYATDIGQLSAYACEIHGGQFEKHEVWLVERSDHHKGRTA